MTGIKRSTVGPHRDGYGGGQGERGKTTEVEISTYYPLWLITWIHCIHCQARLRFVVEQEGKMKIKMSRVQRTERAR